MGEKVINIKWWELFKPIDGIQVGEDLSNKLAIEREIIPIIFVPGIMGSRMKNKEGKIVWNPDDKWFMVKSYGLRNVTAQKRKELIIGAAFDKDFLQVSNDDADHNKTFADKDDVTRAERGWGGVSWSSYGAFLKILQERDSGSDWSEPVRHCFEFPVHACGYNWTASNRDSGEALAKTIDEVIRKYTDLGRICEHVILVTHSMGGLVARSACKLHGAESKVLGVIHGVQPALGSPAAYWRMKGGFDRPGDAPEGEGGFWSFLRNPLKTLTRKPLGNVSAWVLGTDGEEVTSLLGNMPGGLELLPNQNYTSNENKKVWLTFPSADGLSVIELPKNDPYEEIYLAKDVFYRLANPVWLEPGEANTAALSDAFDAWDLYEQYLNEAKKFHTNLNTQVHPQTYQFYSEGLNTCDRVAFRRYALDEELRGSDHWVNRGGFRCYVSTSDIDTPKDSGTVSFAMELEMPPNHPVALVGLQKGSGGDATVPVSSAAALAVLETADVTQDDESYLVRDHEPIFKTKTAQGIAFTAIENLARLKIRQKTGK